MVGVSNASSSMLSTASLVLTQSFESKKLSACNLIKLPNKASKSHKLSCKLQESEVEDGSRRSSNNKMDEYNIAMKRMMRNPYEYHHDLDGVGYHMLLVLEFLHVNSFLYRVEVRDGSHVKSRVNPTNIQDIQILVRITDSVFVE